MPNPLATIEMENGSRILIELLPEQAPNTVHSFIFLANGGHFDAHAIQRIVPGAFADMSYSAFGREACKYLIDPETREAGFANDEPMRPGVIMMGGYGENGIAGGEFFFPYAYRENIDGKYPVFGRVTEGWEEIKRWEGVELRPVTLPQMPGLTVNEPLQPIVLRSVRVETFGVDYPEPLRRQMKEKPPAW